MKKTKRILAFILCLITLLSVFSIIPFAETGEDNYSFRTEILSYNDESSQWEPASKAERGETMKVRFYIGTEFYAGSSQFMLCYPKNSLIFKDVYNLDVNPDWSNASSIDDINFNSAATSVIKSSDFAIPLENFADKYDYSLLIVYADLVDCFIYSSEQWACEAEFTVNSDCEASTLFIKICDESVTQYVEGRFESGFTTVFKGAEGKPAYDLQDAVIGTASLEHDDISVVCTESTHITVDKVVQPTCTEQGYNFHGCKLCGEGQKSNFVPATNHCNAVWRFKAGNEYEKYCPDCQTVIDTKTATVSIGSGVDSISTENGKTTRIYVDADDFITEINAVSSNSILKVTSSGIDTETGKLYVEIEAVGYGDASLTVTVPGTDITDIIPVSIKGKEYTVTWVNGTAKTSVKVREGEQISIPANPSKDYCDFDCWVPEVPATMPSKDIEFVASFTPISYSAKFVADGSVVGTVAYTINSNSISEPSVPHKYGFSGEWESYQLVPGGITVNAVYTASLVPSIRNMPANNQRTEKYKTTITFTALPESLSGNAEVKWYKNNSSAPYATGITCKVEEATDDYTIFFKVFVDGEEVAESETETVYIKHKFFDMLIGFFRTIFRSLDKFEQ